MITNEEIADKFVKKALKQKDKQIKEAIESLIAEIDCKAQQNMPSSTKAIYVAAQLIIKETMNILKQKLNLED